MTGRRRDSGIRTLLIRAAYAVALCGGVATGFLVLSAAAAQGSLGFDYKAYDLAVDNLLAGRTMYDPTVTETGAFGLFFYPPPFALFVVPFALLPTEVGVVAFTAFLVLCSVVAIWVLPLSGWTRLSVGLLAALSWPLLYAIKLGQVGPIILLTFALGWRWLDRPIGLGVTTAIGA